VTLNPAIDQTITIPNFAVGIVNRVAHTQSDPGGKGVNVASFLADYGHTVAVTGFLGRENAELFEALFAQKHIRDDFVRIAGKTRIGIKIADPVQNDTTDINFPGQPPTSDDVDALVKRIEALPGDWVVLAGSLPPNIEPTIYRDLAAMLRAQGRRVAIDTSGDALRHALDATPHIIKPNIHELEMLVGESLGTQAAIVEAAQRLIGQGLQLVAVSMGAQGAVFVNEHTVVTARPPSVEVRSTVGAGDAMVAGLVAGQLHSLPLEICARLATAFSLDAITHLGSGLSSRAVVEAYMEQVMVEEQRTSTD
jgi:1-phosphofructokinase